jgi:hypothetical protein
MNSLRWENLLRLNSLLSLEHETHFSNILFAHFAWTMAPYQFM